MRKVNWLISMFIYGSKKIMSKFLLQPIIKSTILQPMRRIQKSSNLSQTQSTDDNQLCTLEITRQYYWSYALNKIIKAWSEEILIAMNSWSISVWNNFCIFVLSFWEILILQLTRSWELRYRSKRSVSLYGWHQLH